MQIIVPLSGSGISKEKLGLLASINSTGESLHLSLKLRFLCHRLFSSRHFHRVS